MACNTSRCRCNRSQSTCSAKPVNGCQDCSGECKWYPIEETEEEVPMRLCCDQNDCCGMYPESCRNSFWPEFSHPRWLCCKDLYCAR